MADPVRYECLRSQMFVLGNWHYCKKARQFIHMIGTRPVQCNLGSLLGIQVVQATGKRRLDVNGTKRSLVKKDQVQAPGRNRSNGRTGT